VQHFRAVEYRKKGRHEVHTAERIKSYNIDNIRLLLYNGQLELVKNPQYKEVQSHEASYPIIYSVR